MPAKPRSAAIALRGPFTTPQWYPNAKAPKLAMATAQMTGDREAGGAVSPRSADAELCETARYFFLPGEAPSAEIL